tara:strand:- start:350 stop:643 length:294 start_codon:yes stop_codon:yes gene_type:complete
MKWMKWQNRVDPTFWAMRKLYKKYHREPIAWRDGYKWRYEETRKDLIKVIKREPTFEEIASVFVYRYAEEDQHFNRTDFLLSDETKEIRKNLKEETK